MSLTPLANLLRQFSTGVFGTGGKFSTGVVYTNGKF
jgi:hypothetical protein